MSKTYSLKRVQTINVSLQTAWDFFSSPKNLAAITPKEMSFEIRGGEDIKRMYAGQLIEYTVRPVLGIPLYWMTEITQVKEGEFFIDEQRYGPYSFWHHQHFFLETENGVQMSDIVHYRLPFWIAGDIANALFVKKKLATIFDFRFQKIEALFGKK